MFYHHAMKMLLITAICFAFQFAHAHAESVHHYYERFGNWKRFGKSEISLSSFVYRDLNRNGMYDVGDRPMSGVAVELIHNEQVIDAAWSNIHGFANFKASKTRSEKPIHAAGNYTFSVIPPPGWTISSDNAKQTKQLVDIQGSIAGVGFKKMLTPVGLLSPLYITGTAKGDVSIKNINGTGEVMEKESDDGSFNIPVEPGDYLLQAEGISRKIKVSRFPVHVGRLTARSHSGGDVQTATFDDISKSNLRKVPNGYQNLNWFNLNAMRDNFTSKAVGYINGLISEDFVAYSSSGHSAEMTSERPFTLHEVYLSIAWPNAEGETLTIRYYRGDTFIREDEIVLSAFGPVLYQPHIANITKIHLTTKHYWQLVMDDMRFSFD